MPQIPPDPELKATESALGSLTPLASRLDRDNLMFQAGAISGGGAVRLRWAWPAVAAALSVALAGESLLLLGHKSPRVAERIVLVPAPAAGPSERGPVIAHSGATARPVQFSDKSQPAHEGHAYDAWAVVSDYQRRQELVGRFGLDALPDPTPAAWRLSDGDEIDSTRTSPSGLLRSQELKRILEPGDPS
jgi:hypothetical protein